MRIQGNLLSTNFLATPLVLQAASPLTRVRFSYLVITLRGWLVLVLVPTPETVATSKSEGRAVLRLPGLGSRFGRVYTQNGKHVIRINNLAAAESVAQPRQTAAT